MFFSSLYILFTLLFIHGVLPSPLLLDRRDGTGGAAPLLERVDATSDLQTFDDDVQVETALNFKGCSADQKKSIQTAWHDVGLLGQNDGDLNGINLGSGAGSWFFGGGPELALVRGSIIANLKSAAAVRSHWKISDWWYNRKFDMHCDDPGKKYSSIGTKCSGSVSAYQIRPGDKSLKNKYNAIVLCPRFFQLDSLFSRIKAIDDGNFGFSKDDVRSLTSQATTLMHECFHTERKGGSDDPGWTKPRATDKSIRGFPGKAYGPARAKYLARATFGGPRVAYANVDNYVYYLSTVFMSNRWGLTPYKPEAAWNSLHAEDAFGQDAVDNDASDEPIANGNMKDDKTFFGTDEPSICIGSPKGRPSTKQDWAARQIRDFCSYSADNKVKLSKDHNYAAKGYSSAPGSQAQNSLWFGVSWREEAPDGSYTIKKDDCLRLFGLIISKCTTDLFKKDNYGGTAFSKYAVWEITVVNGKSDKAPKGYPNAG